MKKEIYIVRHGETEFNKKHIVQGSGVNSDLNEKGRAQANAFYQAYKNEGFEVVITSDLVRTHQTANGFLVDEIPWDIDPRIQEMNWGVHEGKSSTEEMRAAYKKMIDAWSAGDFDARLEDGESAAELAARLTTFIEDLKQRKEQKIIIFTHGRTIRCFITLLKGEHLREMENKTHNNTGLYKCTYENDTFEFQLENDTAHLAKLEEA